MASPGPSNIMIERLPESDWNVRLTDFGSGRLLQSEHVARVRITQFGLLSVDALMSGSSSATPLYVAPELLACEPASQQSDIYALGVLLYQLLAGDLRRPLVLGWERHVDDELLREDIARATDFDPTRRFASVTELIERIAALENRRVVRHENLERAQLMAASREQSLCRRARRGWMIATLFLSALVVFETALLVLDHTASSDVTIHDRLAGDTE